MQIRITSQHQAYLDSALRDAIEYLGYNYQTTQAPLPPELRKLVLKHCDWAIDDDISESLIAAGAESIWFDSKRIFRLVMLRQGMDPELTEDLKLSDLPPLEPLGSYTIQQDGPTYVADCDALNLTSRGESLESAIENLYHQIRNEFFDDDYRPEEDPRNWAATPDATPEQQAALRFMHSDLYLSKEQKPRFLNAARAGKPLPDDIARSFMRQRFGDDE